MKAFVGGGALWVYFRLSLGGTKMSTTKLFSSQFKVSGVLSERFVLIETITLYLRDSF